MLTPPVKPVTPSQITILRWVRKLKNRAESRPPKAGLKRATCPPASSSGARNRGLRLDEPAASTSSRTVTPARARSTSASRTRVPVRSGAKM